jgi:hypothetical protein
MVVVVAVAAGTPTCIWKTTSVARRKINQENEF